MKKVKKERVTIKFYNSSGNTPSDFMQSDEAEKYFKDRESSSEESSIEPDEIEDVTINTNSIDGLNEDIVLIPRTHQPTKCVIFKNLVISGITGIGVGLGMMPIFNSVLKNSPLFGPDLHKNDIAFGISTANTFIVYCMNSGIQTYSFLSNSYNTNCKQNSIKIVAKVGASLSAIFPVALLWHIEFDNQKITDSSGFDQFFAWATAATIPLVFDKCISSINSIDELALPQSKDINSIGGKVFTYNTSLLALGARAASYSVVGYQIGLDFGMDNTSALAFGIVTAGILGSGGIAVFEYQKLKALFIDNYSKITVKEGVLGTISALEGAWFSIPITSIGLDLMKDLNLSIQATLLVPLCVSNLISESNVLYDSLNTACSWVSEKCTGLLGNSEEYSDA